MAKQQVVFIEGRRDSYGIDGCKGSMTVEDLVEYLSLNFPPDALVILNNDNGYTYGNITEDSIWDTMEEFDGDEE